MDENCTVYKTVNILSKKWSLLIILSIHKSNKKSKRYSMIKSDLPEVTPKILSQRLKELESEDIIRKETDTTAVPIKTSYSLTKSGRELVKVVRLMKKWGLDWKFPNDICSKTNCSECRI